MMGFVLLLPQSLKRFKFLLQAFVLRLFDFFLISTLFPFIFVAFRLQRIILDVSQGFHSINGVNEGLRKGVE